MTGSFGNDTKDAKDAKAILEVIFGTAIQEWTYSEQALLQALELKKEQEKTKQQYYKLENINKCIELLKVAKSVGASSDLLTQIFMSNAMDLSNTWTGDQTKERYSDKNSSESKGVLSPIKLEPLPAHQILNGSETSSANQPLNYKFPPPNSYMPPKSITKPRHQRTHSPARIGAHAVAALNNSNAIKEEETSNENMLPLPANMIPLKFSNDKGPQMHSHRRNMSLPVNTTSYTGMTSVLNFKNPVQKSNESESVIPPRQVQFSNSMPSTLNISPKKHTRSKSSNGFNVIDLTVVEKSGNRPQTPQRNFAQSTDYADEKTCSESSSMNASPERSAKSSCVINKLLNAT